MFRRFIIFCINCSRWVANLWRRIHRRRVDYVRLRLSGAIAEFADAPPRWQRLLLGSHTPLSVATTRQLFAQIAADPQAWGILLYIDSLTSGWATLQSLRAEIAVLRAADKQVVAYLITPDIASSYVACAANSILMPPTAHWNVLGLRSEVQFLREALAKWGIQIEAVAVSPYKSATDTLVRDDFSPESRAQFERLLDARYQELLQAFAQGRNKTVDEIRLLIDQAPLAPKAAIAAGLVDQLCYEDEIETYLRAPEQERELIMIDHKVAHKILQRPYLTYHKQQIGLIRVEGSIMRGVNRVVPLPIPLIGGATAGAESFLQAMRQAEHNPYIAAIVLYVNSPGGEVFASDLMWREVQRIRQKKPIVVAMGNTAASGGYYLATHASAIIAQPATITGSIGVFILRPILAEALEHAAIHTTVVSRGAHSGLLGGSQPSTASEQQALQDLVFALYADFTERVRSGRGLSAEQLEPIADGRVWLGNEALNHGLVDQLGGIPEALLKAQALAGLPANRNATMLLLHGGKEALAPQPFPTHPSAEMLQLVTHILQNTPWALLPFECW